MPKCFTEQLKFIICPSITKLTHTEGVVIYLHTAFSCAVDEGHSLITVHTRQGALGWPDHNREEENMSTKSRKHALEPLASHFIIFSLHNSLSFGIQFKDSVTVLVVLIKHTAK